MKHEHEGFYGLRAPTTLQSTLLLVVSNYTGCTINYSIDRKRNQHTGGKNTHIHTQRVFSSSRQIKHAAYIKIPKKKTTKQTSKNTAD